MKSDTAPSGLVRIGTWKPAYRNLGTIFPVSRSNIDMRYICRDKRLGYRDASATAATPGRKARIGCRRRALIPAAPYGQGGYGPRSRCLVPGIACFKTVKAKKT